MELRVRSDALEWASQQFGRAYVDVADAGRSVASGCNLAASSLAEGCGSAAVASAGASVGGVLDTVCSQLLDIAGGLRSAVISFQAADDSAVGSDPPVRPGGPS
jgi:hypothetical protein